MDLELKAYAYNDRCPKCKESWDAANDQDITLPNAVELYFECPKCGHKRTILLQVHLLEPTVEVELSREHRHLSASVTRAVKAHYPYAEVKVDVGTKDYSTTFVPATYSEEDRAEILMLVSKVLG